MRLRNVHKLIAITAFAAAAAPFAAGCEVLSQVDRSDVPASPECTTTADCSETPGDCTTPSCMDGKCVGQPLAQGTTCSAGGKVCDGAGSCIECNAASECPDTAGDCMVAACEAGACGVAPAAMGDACSDGGGKVCNDAGACVVCNAGTDCADPAGDCEIPTCVIDDKINACVDSPEPLDTTCSSGGGKVCTDAGACVECNNPDQCSSGVCTTNACAAPACDDNVLNGAETDQDCGGGCPGCVDGEKCEQGTDCANGVCTNLLCQPASCGDMLKNGSETDIDCGGSCASKCADTKNCTKAGDCASGVCTGGKCAVPTCNDAVQNGSESDTDCGGSCPTKCATGNSCNGATDCLGGICIAKTCAPSCSDTAKNQDETDVDCGGVCGATCVATKGCNTGGDCVTGACENNVCVAYPSCKELLAADSSLPNGTYQIDPDGPGGAAPFSTYCDMTEDGGGWTLVFNQDPTFDVTKPGVADAKCFSTNCINLAFSTVPVTADLMFDAADANIIGMSQSARTVITGVQPSIVGKTLFAVMNTVPNAFVDLEDNSNVTNTFAAGTTCNTWEEYGPIICATDVLTLNDTDGCSGPFPIGISTSFTVPHANCAGWPGNPGGAGGNYWPDNFRVWVR